MKPKFAVPVHQDLYRGVSKATTDLQLDAGVTASWNFGGFFLVQIDELSTGSLGNAAFVAQSRIRHPTAEAKSLNHFELLIIV